MSQKHRERLLSDLRVFSAAGVERAAWGWDQHVEKMDRFRAAEREALALIEGAERGPAWDEFRRSIFEMTEGRTALVSWQAEHGEIGHKAERAAFGAALGLFAQDRLDRENYVTLVRPMAEALPWLLPQIPPQPHG